MEAVFGPGGAHPRAEELAQERVRGPWGMGARRVARHGLEVEVSLDLGGGGDAGVPLAADALGGCEERALVALEEDQLKELEAGQDCSFKVMCSL